MTIFYTKVKISEEIPNVGKTRTALERIGQRGKEPDNFFGPDCPVLSNPPVYGKLTTYFLAIIL